MDDIDKVIDDRILYILLSQALNGSKIAELAMLEEIVRDNYLAKYKVDLLDDELDTSLERLQHRDYPVELLRPLKKATRGVLDWSSGGY
jgi:hypothetical protein